nr:PREDICTED: uncharacterized protein LOC109029713 [Bemisia tabaci]
MKQILCVLTLNILSALLVHGGQQCNTICNLPEDTLCYDPKLEIVHLYEDQWPTDIAITPCGRKFSCYPSGIDAKNTNNGCNGKYAVAELKKCGEVPYPNYCINNPPNGAINYCTSPPVTYGYPDYFLSVQALLYDCAYGLFCLDAARARDDKQIIYEASKGGTKVVLVDTCSDCVVRTYCFPVDVATPTSYFINMAVDNVKGVMYIADAPGYSIVALDLCTGKSFIAFQGDPTLMWIQGGLDWIWGQPSYSTGTILNCDGNESNCEIQIGSIPFGVSTLSLSCDRKRLYYSQLGGRTLWSVDTKALLAADGVADTIVNHGEKGVTLGLITDVQGLIWSGNAENDAIVYYNPCCAFAKTYLYIRDPRLSWVHGFSEAGDGYMYCLANYINGINLVYPGTGPIYADRRKKPYVLFRYKLPCDCLCPNFSTEPTLGKQVSCE